MTKVWRWMLLLPLLLSALWPVPAQAAACTATTSALTQSQLDALKPGAVLCLRAGTYQPGLLALRVPGPITLQAYPGEAVIWRGTGGSSAAGVFVAQASDWTVRDLTIDDAGLSVPAIVINSSTSGVQLLNDEIMHGTFNGVTVRGDQATIAGSRIHNFNSGVAGADAHCVIVIANASASAGSFQLLGNTIHDCSGDGVQAYYANVTAVPPPAASGVISGNVFYAGQLPYTENAVDTKWGSWSILFNDISGYGYSTIPGSPRGNGNPAVFLHKFTHDTTLANNGIRLSDKGTHIFGNAGLDSGVSPLSITVRSNTYTGITGAYSLLVEGARQVTVITATVTSLPATPVATATRLPSATPTATVTSTPSATDTSTPTVTPTAVPTLQPTASEVVVQWQCTETIHANGTHDWSCHQ